MEQDVSALRSGALRKSQKGSMYVWSRTMDLNDIIREVGTSLVTISVFQRKQGEDVKPEDRVFVFRPSEAKWLPKQKEGSDGGQSNQGTQDNQSDDIIL